MSEKTLKGCFGARLDKQKVLCAPGLRTKIMSVFFYRLKNYIVSKPTVNNAIC